MTIEPQTDTEDPTRTELRPPWSDYDPDIYRGGVEYARLIESVRSLQSAFVEAAGMPPAAMGRLAAQIDQLTGELKDHRAPESGRWSMRRIDLPGRGGTLLPPYVIDEQTSTSIRGRVNFPSFFIGGNGAIFGGAAPLLFDDLLGGLVNSVRDGASRTAFLKVDFRHITPVERDLELTGSIDRIDGRKTFSSGQIREGGRVLCEAEALFVQLRPGQP